MSSKLRQRHVESDGVTEKLLDVDFDDSKKVHSQTKRVYLELINNYFF
jgi:hypothetical protein